MLLFCPNIFLVFFSQNCYFRLFWMFSSKVCLFKYFWVSENGGLCIKLAVIHKQLMQHFDKTPWSRAESLHFNRISSFGFKIHCGGAQFRSANYGHDWEDIVNLYISVTQRQNLQTLMWNLRPNSWFLSIKTVHSIFYKDTTELFKLGIIHIY